MELNQHTLPNGLRIIQAPSATPVAYGGFTIDAGTRDEADNEQGMAHFVEHLIFKGTEKRRAWHILNRMERVGGDLNAFTNKEETTIYTAFLADDFARAAELLADITFHSVFPSQEIGREVEVILDEIQSYEDSPSELIFDDFEELLFHGHPLGRNILGDPVRLRGFGSADALGWTRRFYTPSNMVFFMRGNVDFRRVVRTLEKLTGDREPGTPNRRKLFGLRNVDQRFAPMPLALCYPGGREHFDVVVVIHHGGVVCPPDGLQLAFQLFQRLLQAEKLPVGFQVGIGFGGQPEFREQRR